MAPRTVSGTAAGQSGGATNGSDASRAPIGTKLPGAGRRLPEICRELVHQVGGARGCRVELQVVRGEPVHEVGHAASEAAHTITARGLPRGRHVDVTPEGDPDGIEPGERLTPLVPLVP